MRTLIPIAVLVLLASCRGEPVETKQPSTSSAPVAAQTESAVVVPVGMSSMHLTGVTEQNGTVTISFTEGGEQRQLRGEMRDSGKRKYALAGGPLLYEVKPNDEGGFKLRSLDGKLRWKVKVTPEKIKISDNEQNEHPFELKVRDGDRVKVVAPGDHELGSVRYSSGKIEVETAGGKKIFTTDAAKASGAYGVLLLDTIPDQERYILIAEILSRGR